MYRLGRLLGLVAICAVFLCMPAHSPAEDFKFLPAAEALEAQGPCDFQYLPRQVAERVWVLDASPFRYLADERAPDAAAEVAKAIEKPTEAQQPATPAEELPVLEAYRFLDEPCKFCDAIDEIVKSDDKRKPGTPRRLPFKVVWHPLPQGYNSAPLLAWTDCAGQRHAQMGWYGPEKFIAKYEATQKAARLRLSAKR